VKNSKARVVPWVDTSPEESEVTIPSSVHLQESPEYPEFRIHSLPGIQGKNVLQPLYSGRINSNKELAGPISLKNRN
jgi:hypothetical protein